MQAHQNFITIALQKTVFVSNEIIEGTMNIQLEESFEGHLVDLTIEGMELINFNFITIARKGVKSLKVKYNNTGENKLISFSIPIYDFYGGTVKADSKFKIKPGQWQIPFSIQVGSSLPSSTKSYRDQYNNFTLRYRLIAKILPTDSNCKPVLGYQDICICQQIQQNPNDNSKSLEQSPSSCCGGGSGAYTLAATLNKMIYAPNETIFVALNCDLSGYSGHINCLEVAFIGKIDLQGGVRHDRNAVEILNISHKVKITAKQVKDTVQFQIPESQPLTSIGHLMKLHYFISIFAEINDSGGLFEYPPLEIPLILNADQKSVMAMIPPPLNQVETPANWRPQQLQQTIFSEDQSFEYQKMQNKLMQSYQPICSQDYSQVMMQPEMSEAYKNSIVG